MASLQGVGREIRDHAWLPGPCVLHLLGELEAQTRGDLSPWLLRVGTAIREVLLEEGRLNLIVRDGVRGRSGWKWREEGPV